MKILKKIILTALCACCAVLVGIASVGLNKQTKTVKADVAAEYTTVDTAMMMKLENVYVEGGNFNIYITLFDYDTTTIWENAAIPGVDLASVFDSFGFFDKVKIGEKTLREWGCNGFYDNKMDFGVGEPKNIIRVRVHADPATWSAGYNNHEIRFGDNQTPITMEEGLIIPGYTYLMGQEDAKVYRAEMTYISERNTPLTYSYVTAAQTEVESVKYVQGHDGTCGYLGVSLVGDDYAADGNQKVFFPQYRDAFNGENLPNAFNKKILVNGQAGKVDTYALLNLGEAGKGYFSFVIWTHQDEVESITIPKGTYFPSCKMEAWKNLNGHMVHIGYTTQTDMTFYKNANGEFVLFAGYADVKTNELNALRASKTETEYFSADLAAMDEKVSVAISALATAATVAEVDEAFAEAKAFIDGTETKGLVIANAKADLSVYKTGLFREAEETERLAVMDAANSIIESAGSKADVEAAVANAKVQIDALKTAAQYADEELAVDKAAANATISGYLADVEYLAEEAAVRAAAIEAGLAAVVAASNVEEINAAVADAKAAIDVLTDKATIVNEAKAVVEAYKADKVYREAEKTARLAAIAAANTALDNATCQADVDNAVATAIATIDALKTDVELTEEEKAAADALFAADKAAVLMQVNELKATVIFEEYTVENQAVINELYRLAKKSIADALTKEEIEQAAIDFETALAAVEKISVEDNEGEENPIPDDSDTDVDSDVDSSVDSSVDSEVNTDSDVSVDDGKQQGVLGGCQSSASLAGIVTMTALGVAVLFRKKKEN